MPCTTLRRERRLHSSTCGAPCSAWPELVTWNRSSIRHARSGAWPGGWPTRGERAKTSALWRVSPWTRAWGVGPGDEVMTVSHSFIATANTIRYCGAEPVFVDIDPRTYNLDPRLLNAAITPRTRAVLAVHQMGLPCDMPGILRVADAKGLPVIEDAACAIGSEMHIDGTWA